MRPRRSRSRSPFLGSPQALALAVSTFAASSCTDTEPTLVVLLSVDQMRGDFMDAEASTNYTPAFREGLATLLNEGLVFPDAAHDHAVTHTAPGHTALATGVHPARSGIVANTWQERSDEGLVSRYAVVDESSPLVGLAEPGAELVRQRPSWGRSPLNMERDGLGDWTMTHDSNALAIAVSVKDRSAITLAGRSGQAYWVSPRRGRIVTSSYYADMLPHWVEAFNSEVMPTLVTDTVWESMVWPDVAGLAREDAADQEGDGVHTTFPHLSSQEAGDAEADRLAWLFRTPRADDVVLAFARQAVEELRLGSRGSVDYLAISLSATDYVGHDYGPFSQEQLSNLIHLDEALGRFIAYLDLAVGEGRWIAALSSDHGVATTPEAGAKWGATADGRVDQGAQGQRILDIYRRASEESEGSDDLPGRLAGLLNESELFVRAYTHAEILADPAPDSFAALFANSWHPERFTHPLAVAGVDVLRRPGDFRGWGSRGTTHGSPHRYDRWVPVIFFGGLVEARVDRRPAKTVDVAPTLALLAGIPTPDDLDGKPLAGR